MITPEETAELLRQLSLAITQYVAALARAMNLGVSEVLAMQHLYQSEGFTVSTLGSRLSMTSGAVTALVDRLQARGYVSRHPHPTDRRSFVLALTPLGAQEAVRHIRPLFQEVSAASAALSDGDRVRVADFLERVVAIQRAQALRLTTRDDP